MARIEHKIIDWSAVFRKFPNDPEVEKAFFIRELIEPFMEGKFAVTISLDCVNPVEFGLAGDLEPLISHIEKGGDLNGDEIRNFFLHVLRTRKVPSPKHRPRRAATLLRHFAIAWCVATWRANGLGTEASIKKAMDVFNVDRTTVQRALKKPTN